MPIVKLPNRVAARLNRGQLRPYHPTPEALERRRAAMQFEVLMAREIGARRA